MLCTQTSNRAQQLFTSTAFEFDKLRSSKIQITKTKNPRELFAYFKKNTTHKTRNFVDPRVMSVASTREGDAFAYSNDNDVNVVLESPEMNEKFDYKKSKNVNNGRNDDDEEEEKEKEEEEEEKEKEEEEEEKQLIDIADEADEVCFQIERVIHRLMSSLASEICQDEAFPIEYYDINLPLFEWCENTTSFVESEKTKSIRLNTITFARIIAMLNLIHTNVRQGKTVTQREMYYCASAKEPLLFSKVAHVLDSIKNIASLLRVNRGTLNITCSSKGLVAGLVSLRNDATQTFVDCSKLEGSGFSIPGDLKAIESVSIDASTCDFILVVEKDAVFNKLLQEKIWERYPCAIVTAKGFPDLPTRAFLHRLASSGVRDTCTIFVLVDWNPAGLWIYSTYVTGGASNVNESTRYAIPNTVFLGVSHDDILAAGKVLTAKHTKKEARDIENILRKKRGPLYSIFKTELEQMHALGRKCEIEGLYASNESDEYVFSEFLAAKVLRLR